MSNKKDATYFLNEKDGKFGKYYTNVGKKKPDDIDINVSFGKQPETLLVKIGDEKVYANKRTGAKGEYYITDYGDNGLLFASMGESAYGPYCRVSLVEKQEKSAPQGKDFAAKSYSV